MTTAHRNLYADALGGLLFSCEIIAIVVATLMLAMCAGHAQTKTQIDACRSDAERICPNSLSIASARSCLVAHRSMVSRACKDAFTAEK